MLKKDPNYRRLKLGGSGLLGRSSFWLGPDHLLVVEVAGAVEKYRRFYFRDIQAVIIQKTNVRLWWGIGWSVLLLFSLLGFLMSAVGERDDVGLAFSAVFSFFFGLGLFLTFFFGQTCVVLLRTAVQTQALPNISRRKKATLLLAQLPPAVLAAQTASPSPVSAGEPGPSPGPVAG